MKNAIPFLILVATVACQVDSTSDAYGNFEATEVIVSAEATGRLIDFFAEEGSGVKKGLKL